MPHPRGATGYVCQGSQVGRHRERVKSKIGSNKKYGLVSRLPYQAIKVSLKVGRGPQFAGNQSLF